MEELTEIIGCFCSLLCNPDDYSTDRIVCYYGRDVVAELRMNAPWASMPGTFSTELKLRKSISCIFQQRYGPYSES